MSYLDGGGIARGLTVAGARLQLPVMHRRPMEPDSRSVDGVKADKAHMEASSLRTLITGVDLLQSRNTARPK
ncbi:predicted protein [Pyrenophora tritici-repentis Pt-1C-BFP]|uniref:Uncharacterized protein n=1 Tax=Pyrenophora tritici-repentis (strain Pt-1C-BFP) TaxID=426418 RepID=B2WDH5_PYRTR|nr:uncharacterized protein PTRG_08034 [Pyrenophora tritici-repentis Pt-1C-BFP]EDU50953.1 predicted protein [Pyrenophora tritici-repentis Pt-1C-BFP]